MAIITKKKNLSSYITDLRNKIGSMFYNNPSVKYNDPNVRYNGSSYNQVKDKKYG